MEAKRLGTADRGNALADIIAASPIAAVISDPRLQDNPIVDCNQAFIEFTGYSREEIIGRNYRFLAGSETEADLTSLLRQGIAARRPVMVELLNYKKDGRPFRNAVMVAPIFDAKGELEYFLGPQVVVMQDAKPRETLRRKAAQAEIEKLTPRQRAALKKMVAGKPNKQIAFDMNISERPVKMHNAEALRVLGVPTRADAIRLTVETEL
jgi:PAS domain S-box-containing protein